MEPQDSHRFYVALISMADFFCDELSENRQRVYWQLFQQDTIEAWEFACQVAMDREKFYKVPLPAVLREFIREYEWRTALVHRPLLGAPNMTEEKRRLERAKTEAQLDQDIAHLSPEAQARIAAQMEKYRETN